MIICSTAAYVHGGKERVGSDWTDPSEISPLTGARYLVSELSPERLVEILFLKRDHVRPPKRSRLRIFPELFKGAAKILESKNVNTPIQGYLLVPISSTFN